MSNSILVGGNKEIFQNIYSLADLTNKRLSEVYAGGVSAIDENTSTQTLHISQISAIVSKLKELESNLLFINSVYSLPIFEKLRNKEMIYGMVSDLQQRRRVGECVLKGIEKLLATEISFLYFLNLNFDVYRAINFSVSPSSLVNDWVKVTLAHIKSLRADELLGGYAAREWAPRKTLNRILDVDVEIKNLYCPFIAAAVRYQREVLSSMVNAFDKYI